MPYNLYLHDADFLCGRVLPIFVECRRRRSFRPLFSLASWLEASLADLSFVHATEGMPYDRHVFDALVGQILVLAAHAVPNLPLDVDTLTALLAPDRLHLPRNDRPALSPAEQLFLGSRDLLLGHRPFRPLHVGWHRQSDVHRLADYFHRFDPAAWTPDALLPFPSAPTDEDREHELGIVRDWWPELLTMLRIAASAGQVIICEDLS